MKSVLPTVLAMGLLAACEAKPLPPDKADYAGHWRGEGVDLVIETSGQVRFKKLEGKGQVQVSGPINQWLDEDFVVGAMVVRKKFDVAEPPHQVGEAWLMTVDGVQLLREAE